MSNDNSIVRSMKITCPHCGAAIIHLYEDDHDAIDALQRENAAVKAEAMLWRARAVSYDGQIDDRDMEMIAFVAFGWWLLSKYSREDQ